MHRFFVSPSAIRGNQVTLSGPVAHQIARVLRLRAGRQIVVLDDSGWEHTVELQSVNPEQILGRMVQREEAAGEPHTQITLYQAVLKGERFEWVLQKGTELGIAAFVPLLCARNVVREPAAVQKREKRWRTIIREAAEQSRRGRLPKLEQPLPFAAACRQVQAQAGPGLLAWEGEPAAGPGLLAWEGEPAASLKQTLRADISHDRPASANVQVPDRSGRLGFSSIQLLVGPEGGFTPEEVALARAHSIRPITLGRRILRAETAGIVAAAAVLYESGDLG